MMRKTLSGLAFAVGCAIALAAHSPHAQMTATQGQTRTVAPRADLGDHADWMTGRNNAESTQYERLLGRNEANLQYRMQRECGSIANAHLRTGCMDSLAIENDRRSMGLKDGLTGGGQGRMNPIDRTFQGPDMYDPHLGR